MSQERTAGARIDNTEHPGPPSRKKRGAPKQALHSVPSAVLSARRRLGARARVAERRPCVICVVIACVGERARARCDDVSSYPR